MINVRHQSLDVNVLRYTHVRSTGETLNEPSSQSSLGTVHSDNVNKKAMLSQGNRAMPL